MKNTKLILLFLLTCMLLNVQAQKKKNEKQKCKLVFNKELGMELYENVDSVALPLNENLMDSIFMTDDFKLKGITKKYPEKQMASIVYMIDNNGKASLIKVLTPTGDKEIEAEAKRIVDLIPLYKPCKCKGEPVPCYGAFNIPVASKPRNKVN